MNMNNYLDYMLEQAKNLLAIDSPSGYTAEVTSYLLEEYKKLGYHAELTNKGGVLADLGGEGTPFSSLPMWTLLAVWSLRSRETAVSASPISAV